MPQAIFIGNKSILVKDSVSPSVVVEGAAGEIPTVNADTYSDSFTAFSADGYNHDSAIWKILDAHSYTNVRIVMSNKVYKPVMVDSSATLLTLNNVSIIGAGVPSYKPDLTGLVGGSIIQGCFVVSVPSSNLLYKDFGVDAGRDVTNTYYGGVGTEGLIHSYTNAGLPWGVNVTIDNITVILREPNIAKHGLLVERVDGARLDRIRTCFGWFGLAIKARNVTCGDVHTYGLFNSHIIIKADSPLGNDTNTQQVKLGTSTGAQLPPEATTPWITVPRATYGVILQAYISIQDIDLGVINMKYCSTAGLFLQSNDASVLQRIRGNALICDDVFSALVRYGNGGIVKHFHIDYIHGNNVRDFLADIEGPNSDQDVDLFIGRLSNSGTSTAFGIFIQNGATLDVGSFTPQSAGAALNLGAASRLILRNYTPAAPIPFLAAGSIAPISTSSSVFSGTAAPVTIPNNIGDSYIDIVAKKEYKAMGTSSSADWVLLN